MALFFYKKFSIQTKRNGEEIKKVFSDAINNPRHYAGLERAISDGWLVLIGFSVDRFDIALKYKYLKVFQREGIRTVLKGRIREDKNTDRSVVSMVVRPSDGYIILLSFVFVAISTALFYGSANNITGLTIVSSILLFFWYFGFLLHFNSQIKTYRQIIESCFRHHTYDVMI